MVEIKNQHTSQEKLKLPKNIRQIGVPGTGKKIYVEDYVITYMNQLAKDSGNRQTAAVLLGSYSKADDVCLTFINGAVAIPEAEIGEDTIAFGSSLWEKIYDAIQTYFHKVEIVGWFLTRPGKSLGVNEKIMKIHVDQFPGSEKALFMMDPLDREDAFYIYESGKLTKQHGYYIYYDRNEDMQNYMVETRKRPTTDLEVDDGGFFRTHISERRLLGNRKTENISAQKQLVSKESVKAEKAAAKTAAKKQSTKSKHPFKVTYAATALAAMLVLLVGMTFMNRYYGKPKVQSASSISNKASNETISVEVIEGNIQSNKNSDKETAATGNQAETVDTEDSDIQNGTQGLDDSSDSDSEAASTLSGSRRYTVRVGDTLANISIGLYDTRDYVDEICELNDIEDPDLIFEGMVLELP